MDKQILKHRLVMPAILLLSLLSCGCASTPPSTPGIESWRCTTDDTEAIIELGIEENAFILRRDTDVMHLAPVFTTGDVLTYGKTKPGTDDERVITERMVRLDRSDGHLVLLENPDGLPRLTTASCTLR